MAGIGFGGVGNYFRHNSVSGGPHTAFFGAGKKTPERHIMCLAAKPQFLTSRTSRRCMQPSPSMSGYYVCHSH